jgi:hypothetical protein
VSALAQAEAGGATRLLRVEGAVVLTTAVLVWAHAVDGSWLLFVLLFLLPDLSMIGYVKGPRVGAIAYNLAHTYTAPAVLASLAFVGAPMSVWRLAIIWVAHIGFDRLMGYGLKHATGFKHTHLGTIGRAAPPPPQSTTPEPPPRRKH